MKKSLAMALALIMLFTFIPFSASADEAQGSDNPLIEKAVTVFPEYADKLLNTQSSGSDSVQAASEGERVLVVSESRTFSDSEVITYSEYSDGTMLLSGYTYTYETTLQRSSTGSDARRYVIDIEAACVAGKYNGYFYLKGVDYTLNTGDNVYDEITSAGTATKGTNCTSAKLSYYKATEALDGNATIIYNLKFKCGSGSSDVTSSRLTFSVGGDTAVCDHLAS